MEFKGKKVCVFGIGASGISAIKLLLALECEVFVVNQGPPEEWRAKHPLLQSLPLSQCISEGNAQAVFAEADLIIISPGIDRGHPALNLAHAQGVPLWSEIELGYQFVTSPVIAITGTNGKTTTTMLMESMLKYSGKSSFVGGNIGTPLCDYSYEIIKKERASVDWVILELSSFQLESIESFKPHIAILLNLTPHHGERYAGVEDYAQAKFNISKNMVESDVVIFSEENPLIKEWAEKLQVQKIGFSQKKVLDELPAHYDLGRFCLKGVHNLENLYCIHRVSKILGNPPEVLQKLIDNFPGVPHRIEFVPSPLPFLAFNDSKSSNFDATCVALRSLHRDYVSNLNETKEIYLILGGKKRGRNDSVLPHFPEIQKYAKKIFLVGETTDLLGEELKGKIPYSKTYTLEQTLQEIVKEGFQGVVLLSPAFPSFDQFQSYGHRGNVFKELLINCSFPLD